MKKIIIFMLFFVLITSCFVSANNVFSTYGCTFWDNFDTYDNDFTSHGWVESEGGSQHPVGTLRYMNWTYASNIARNADNNATNGIFTMTFSVGIRNTQGSLGSSFQFRDRSQPAQNDFNLFFSTSNTYCSGLGTNEFCVVYNNGTTYVDTDIQGNLGEGNFTNLTIWYDFSQDTLKIFEGFTIDGVASFQKQNYQLPEITWLSISGAVGGEGILVDNIGCEETISCNYPAVFCDDFNYDTAMYTKGWLIDIGGGQINQTFTPIKNELNLTQGYYLQPYHFIDPFPVNYPKTQDITIVTTQYAPVFSSQFDLNHSAGNFEYISYDNVYGTVVYALLANKTASGNNISWYAYNGSDYIEICYNCSTANQFDKIKISAFFDHSPYYPFNSTNPYDYVALYINNDLKNNSIDFVSNKSLLIDRSHFFKTASAKFTIDNYIMMAGTDPYVDTTSTFSSLYYDVTENATETGEYDATEFENTVDDIWGTWGLNTARSRTMFGLGIMLLFGIFIVGAMLKMGHLNLGVVGLLEFFLMIFLVFLRLIPTWVVYITAILAVGLGALYIKINAT